MMTPGTKLGGRYRLDERIATGGMGDVWRATDEVLTREVAVKVLLPSLLNEPGFVERFRAEARVVATLTHPNIVRVYDYGESPMEGGGHVAYLVMEFVSGEALTARLQRKGRLTAAEALPLIAQAGEALHAAHEHGIVHRDVKPGNLLIKPDDTVMLTDFGIARSAMSGGLTQAGSILGTAAYVSPEQASGQTITGQADLYSLGIVTYQCLAGQRPYDSDNPMELALKHVNEEPPPLPEDVPVAARVFVSAALAKDPAQRFKTGQELAAAARATVEGEIPASGAMTPGPAAPGPATPTSTPYPAPPQSPPHRPEPHSAPASQGWNAPPGLPQQPQPGVPGAAQPNEAPSQAFATGHAAAPPGKGLDPNTSVGLGAPQTFSDPPKQSGNKMLLIVGAVALVLVLLVGGGIALYATGGNSGGQEPSASGSEDESGTDSEEDTFDIVVEDYVGMTTFAVKDRLEKEGFTNVVITGTSKRHTSDIQPNGPQPFDAEIVVVGSEPGSTSSWQGDEEQQSDGMGQPGPTGETCIPRIEDC